MFFNRVKCKYLKQQIKKRNNFRGYVLMLCKKDNSTELGKQI